MLRRAFDWAFRSRDDGRIVLAQVPNLPLGLFLVATAADRAFEPAGSAGTVVRSLATAGALWWATDEVLRGVNPFRRVLGAIVLALVVHRLVN